MDDKKELEKIEQIGTKPGPKPLGAKYRRFSQTLGVLDDESRARGALPRTPANPRKLLDKAMNIIKRDLTRLDAVSRARLLNSDEANALVKYSEVLRKGAVHVKEEIKEGVQDVQKLSDEELREIVARLKDDDDVDV